MLMYTPSLDAATWAKIKHGFLLDKYILFVKWLWFFPLWKRGSGNALMMCQKWMSAHSASSLEMTRRDVDG